MLDRPYGTEFRVGPEPFELVRREIGENHNEQDDGGESSDSLDFR